MGDEEGLNASDEQPDNERGYKTIVFLVFCHNFSIFIPLVVDTCRKMYLILKV